MKKTLTIALLGIFLSLSSVILSGCSQETAKNGENNKVVAENEVIENTEAPAPVDEKINDEDIGMEINELDSAMEEVEVTGFEADNLADKDLGL